MIQAVLTALQKSCKHMAGCMQDAHVNRMSCETETQHRGLVYLHQRERKEDEREPHDGKQSDGRKDARRSEAIGVHRAIDCKGGDSSQHRGSKQQRLHAHSAGNGLLQPPQLTISCFLDLSLLSCLPSIDFEDTNAGQQLVGQLHT